MHNIFTIIHTILNIWLQEWFINCSIINLLWSLIVDDECDVSTRHLRALFTYWCHVCCLRFQRDNLVNEAICMKQRAPTMKRDQGYHLHAIYNQFVPPKSEATRMTPVHELGP